MSDITHIARLGTLTDSDVRTYIRSLTEMDAQLAELQADIAKAAGELQKQEKQLSGAQKKLLKEFKDKLPETVKGQGKLVVELRDVLLAYTKVAAEKPLTNAMLRGGVLEQAEERFGADVREALEDIFDAVSKEHRGLKKAVANIKYSRTASEDKEAGVMDWLAAVGDFFGRIYKALVRIFDMATAAISGSVSRVNKSFDAYKKAAAAAEKFASSDDGLLRRLLAEEGMTVTADDDDDDGDDDDKSDDDKSDDDDKDEKKASSDDDDDDDSDKKATNDFGFDLF